MEMAVAELPGQFVPSVARMCVRSQWEEQGGHKGEGAMGNSFHGTM